MGITTKIKHFTFANTLFAICFDLLPYISKYNSTTSDGMLDCIIQRQIGNLYDLTNTLFNLSNNGNWTGYFINLDVQVPLINQNQSQFSVNNNEYLNNTCDPIPFQFYYSSNELSLARDE